MRCHVTICSIIRIFYMANSSLSTKPKVEKIHTGLEQRDTIEVAKKLSEALADSFLLYLKTLGVHWNIVGPTFYSMHKLTEAQYEDLQAAIDELAERIRSLGYPAPASFGDYAKLSKLDSSATLETAEIMLKSLVDDNEVIARRLRGAVAVAAEADDVVTADLLTQRIGKHEQNAWMLRAVIG
jgi:starvation-inducible DNA-binding protein